MALGQVVKGRNDKGARWHWANRQRVKWQKGEMVNGQKDNWARWQRGKAKWEEKLGELGMGEMGLGKLGRHRV